MHRLHQDEQVYEEARFDLDEIASQGTRRMLAEALEAEVQDYLEAARGERDEPGRALVVRPSPKLILLVYSSATLHTPGSSPDSQLPGGQRDVDAPGTDRSRTRRYRSCSQGCLPQRKLGLSLPRLHGLFVFKPQRLLSV